MPYQTPQPRRQMKDLRDSGGTAREQGSKELAGSNLRETAFDIKGKQTATCHVQEFMCVQGRQAEENEPFSSFQCNCFAIFVFVLSSLTAKVVITNRKKVT